MQIRVKEVTKSKPVKIGGLFGDEVSWVNEKRYVLVDAETGNVVDSAQGYGYKTPQKAYASWSYKQKQKGEPQTEAPSENGQQP